MTPVVHPGVPREPRLPGRLAHPWIPMSWVTRVDEHVHVDRPGQQALLDWLHQGRPLMLYDTS